MLLDNSPLINVLYTRCIANVLLQTVLVYSCLRCVLKQ